MEKVTASIEETCAALGLGRSNVYLLIGAGRLQTVKIGKRRLVKVASIHELIERAAA